MSEQTRILQLLEDGKIDQDEAALLLDALGATPDENVPSTESSPKPPATPETPRTVRVTSSSSSSSSGTTTTSLGKDGFRTTSHYGPTPPEPPEPPEPPMPTSFSDTSFPEVRGWLRIEVLAGNIKVSTDDSLDAPTVTGRGNGGFTVTQRGERYEVQQTRGGFETGNVTVEIPTDFGVEVDSRLGNVTIRGAAAVRGRVTAGNVKVRDTRGIDLVMKAGELDVTARLSEGRHRIESQAGNVSVKLLEGSSLTLTGKMIVGEANVCAPFRLDKNSFRADQDDDTSFWARVDKQLWGATLSGRLGDGSATLDLSLKAGNLSVKADDTDHDTDTDTDTKAGDR